MTDNIKKYSCGGCGISTFTMYKNHITGEIISECTGVDCKSRTRIVVSPATISLQWGQDDQGNESSGTMTHF
jgi:hypothetical protein